MLTEGGRFAAEEKNGNLKALKQSVCIMPPPMLKMLVKLRRIMIRAQ